MYISLFIYILIYYGVMFLSQPELLTSVRKTPSFVVVFVLVIVAALCAATYVFVPRFFPRDSQLYVPTSELSPVHSSHAEHPKPWKIPA